MKYLFYTLECSERADNFLDTGQILRFSCIEADASLRLHQFHDLTCQYRRDLIPDVMHVMENGLTPNICVDGLDELTFAKQVHSILNQPNTELVGFQSNPYDDERLRRLFFRNLLDPYSHEWQNSSARFDFERILSAIWVMKPDAITWGTTEKGRARLFSKTFFKRADLSELAQLNVSDFTIPGGISSGSSCLHRAHAMYRLYTSLALEASTRGMVSLIRDVRLKSTAREMMSKTDALYVIAGFPGHGATLVDGNAAILLPLKASNYPNGYFALSLNQPIDLQALSAMSELDLQKAFRKGYECQISGVPIVHIKLNHLPTLIPIEKIRPQTLDSLRLPTHEEAYARVEELRASIRTIRDKLGFIEFKTFPKDPDRPVDLSLYDTPFLSYKDRAIVDKVVQNKPLTTWLDELSARCSPDIFEQVIRPIASVVIARHEPGYVRQPENKSLHHTWVNRILALYNKPSIYRHNFYFKHMIASAKKAYPEQSEGLNSLVEHHQHFAEPIFSILQNRFEAKEEAARQAGEDLVFGMTTPPF